MIVIILVVILLIIFINIWLFPILYESKPSGSEYDKFVFKVSSPKGPHHFLLSLFSIGYFKLALKRLYIKLKKQFTPAKRFVKHLEKAIDAKLVTIDGRSLSLLKDYVKKFYDIPLVINIGSCT